MKTQQATRIARPSQSSRCVHHGSRPPTPGVVAVVVTPEAFVTVVFGAPQ